MYRSRKRFKDSLTISVNPEEKRYEVEIEIPSPAESTDSASDGEQCDETGPQYKECILIPNHQQVILTKISCSLEMHVGIVLTCV